MSFDKKEGRLQTAWIWIGFIVFITGVILFTTYGMSLGPISGEHAAWASFGSLLAGFFTIAATGATIATLLFLAKQNKDMQKVTQAQLDSLTFERYINHRKLFIEQLHETISVHKGTFRFRDPNHLYNSIFFENSPHHCTFSVSPDFDARGNAINHIAKMLKSIERVKEFLDCTKFEDGESFDFVMMLITLSEHIFMIEPVGEVRDGDVIFNGKDCGFNIFSIEDFLNPCLTIINVILKFTNNELIDEAQYQPKSRYLREMLVNDFLLNEYKSVIEVRKSIKGIGLLASSYYKSQEVYEEYDFIFPHAVATLSRVFSSADSVNEMIDDEKFNDVLNVCLGEVSQKVYMVGVGHKHCEASISLYDLFFALISRKGFL